MITKKSWIVRANIAFVDGDYYPIHEEFLTRDKARDYKRLLKDMGNWENVKMYHSTEISHGKGLINIFLRPVR